MRGGVAFGLTTRGDPQHPFLANDYGGSAQGLYGLFIHELGNALGFLTWKYDDAGGVKTFYDENIRPTAEQQRRWETDNDPGVVFEDCVLGRMVR